MAKLYNLSCKFLMVAALLFLGCKAEDQVGIYQLKNGDLTIKLTNYGAIVMSIIVPDKNGKMDDIALGFDNLDDYKHDGTYFGSIVGRVANRIGKSQFTLNGTTYKLPSNDGNNTLHGGPKGYADVIWSVYSYVPDHHITFTYQSTDGEEGFPGDLSVSVTYMIIGNNKLGIKMVATPLNKPTPVNLAFHGYWNLNGHSSGDILSHTIQIFGNNTTPVDSALIPTGDIVPVQGTPYDFLESAVIGDKIGKLPDGFDINYALEDINPGHVKTAAVLYDSVSGRKLELWTNKPGLQFYTGNMLHDVKGKEGAVYHKHDGLCLETQGFPDSVNHDNFPSQIVQPGETYEHVMIYRFTAG